MQNYNSVQLSSLSAELTTNAKHCRATTPKKMREMLIKSDIECACKALSVIMAEARGLLHL